MAELPVRTTAALSSNSISNPKYGKEILKEFPFEPGWLNLNHGSFGSVPTSILTSMRDIQARTEAAPDRFIRYEYPHLLDASRLAVSKLLDVPTDTVVFVPNATTGINIVLRNLVYEKGDVIIYFKPFVYGSCERTIEYVCEITPAESFAIGLDWPFSDQKMVQDFEKAIDDIRAQGKNPKIALFDTVVSMPGVRLPFERLIAVCKQKNVLSLVDAAHGVGMLDPKTDLRLTETDPDFWVSNAHKWLLVPRGCAVFYVPKRNQKLIRSTLPTSHGFIPMSENGKGIVNPFPAKKRTKLQDFSVAEGEDAVEMEPNSAYVTAFEFTGTVDNAPYLCVKEGIKFREDNFGGEAKIAEYLKKLARKGGEIFSQTLGTEILENPEGTLGNCAFSNVRLPLDSVEVAKEAKLEENAVGGVVRDWMCETLVQEYKSFMQFLFYKGHWYVRLSSAVYLDEEDFTNGAKILLDICERIKKGGWATG